MDVAVASMAEIHNGDAMFYDYYPPDVYASRDSLEALNDD